MFVLVYCWVFFVVFLGKFTEPIAWHSQWWAFTSQLVSRSQQDYLPDSPHCCEKNPQSPNTKQWGSQSGPLQLAPHCQGFTFQFKSHNEHPLEKEVNKAVMHIDSYIISLLISSPPKVRTAELVWHMISSPLQHNTYQLQSFKVSYHFVSTMTAYVSKKTWKLHPTTVDKIFYFHDYFSAFFYFACRQRLAYMSREHSPAGACSIENCILQRAHGTLGRLLW